MLSSEWERELQRDRRTILKLRHNVEMWYESRLLDFFQLSILFSASLWLFSLSVSILMKSKRFARKMKKTVKMSPNTNRMCHQSPFRRSKVNGHPVVELFFGFFEMSYRFDELLLTSTLASFRLTPTGGKFLILLRNYMWLRLLSGHISKKYNHCRGDIFIWDAIILPSNNFLWWKAQKILRNLYHLFIGNICSQNNLDGHLLH